MYGSSIKKTIVFTYSQANTGQQRQSSNTMKMSEVKSPPKNTFNNRASEADKIVQGKDS
jgi:hypothetical protein